MVSNEDLGCGWWRLILEVFFVWTAGGLDATDPNHKVRNGENLLLKSAQYPLNLMNQKD